jgi:hypothetical protein
VGFSSARPCGGDSSRGADRLTDKSGRREVLADEPSVFVGAPGVIAGSVNVLLGRALATSRTKFGVKLAWGPLCASSSAKGRSGKSWEKGEAYSQTPEARLRQPEPRRESEVVCKWEEPDLSVHEALSVHRGQTASNLRRNLESQLWVKPARALGEILESLSLDEFHRVEVALSASA